MIPGLNFLIFQTFKLSAPIRTPQLRLPKHSTPPLCTVTPPFQQIFNFWVVCPGLSVPLIPPPLQNCFLLECRLPLRLAVATLCFYFQSGFRHRRLVLGFLK